MFLCSLHLWWCVEGIQNSWGWSEGKQNGAYNMSHKNWSYLQLYMTIVNLGTKFLQIPILLKSLLSLSSIEDL